MSKGYHGMINICANNLKSERRYILTEAEDGGGGGLVLGVVPLVL